MFKVNNWKEGRKNKTINKFHYELNIQNLYKMYLYMYIYYKEFMFILFVFFFIEKQKTKK